MGSVLAIVVGIAAFAAMAAYPVAAAPVRWGHRGAFIMAFGVLLAAVLLFAGVLTPDLVRGPLPRDWTIAGLLLVVLVGWAAGAAMGVTWHRRRYGDDAEYLLRAAAGCVGSILGAATGFIVGVAIARLGMTVLHLPIVFS